LCRMTQIHACDSVGQRRSASAVTASRRSIRLVLLRVDRRTPGGTCPWWSSRIRRVRRRHQTDGEAETRVACSRAQKGSPSRSFSRHGIAEGARIGSGPLPSNLDSPNLRGWFFAHLRRVVDGPDDGLHAVRRWNASLTKTWCFCYKVPLTYNPAFLCLHNCVYTQQYDSLPKLPENGNRLDLIIHLAQR